VDRVIYPPVDTQKFSSPPADDMSPGNYYLTVSRLVGYKRVDIVIDAFTRLGWPLKVIGSGWQLGELKRRAGKNIEFIGSDLTDTDLVHYYKACRAFVFAGVEDFGLVSVEAQASGKPVIAYKDGGMVETVVPGKTGLLFDQQNSESLIEALLQSRQIKFSSELCQKNAKRFDLAIFKQSFYNFVREKYQSYQKGLS
jgi:glycosyltransferase involved in cell wall biosynthesis